MCIFITRVGHLIEPCPLCSDCFRCWYGGLFRHVSYKVITKLCESVDHSNRWIWFVKESYLTHIARRRNANKIGISCGGRVTYFYKTPKSWPFICSSCVITKSGFRSGKLNNDCQFFPNRRVL